MILKVSAELVRDERARELCYEGNRKMDLRRWGKDYFEKRIKMLADQNIIVGGGI